MHNSIGLIEPRQVILVSTSAQIEIMGKKIHKENIITVDWHMPCSYKPFHYAISIGKTEFSHKLISQSHIFCVNFMPLDCKDQIIMCGRKSGHVIDKFKESGLTK